MSQIQYRGFADINGWTFGTCRVLSFAGRQGGSGPRWNVICSVCQSQWIEGHAAITEAGTAYRCRNTACGQLHRIKPQKPKAIEHEPKPEPIQWQPSGLKVSPEYARYAAFVRANGGEPGSYADFSQLDSVYRAQLMAPVEAQAYADALEQNEQRRLKEQHEF